MKKGEGWRGRESQKEGKREKSFCWKEGKGVGWKTRRDKKEKMEKRGGEKMRVEPGNSTEEEDGEEWRVKRPLSGLINAQFYQFISCTVSSYVQQVSSSCLMHWFNATDLQSKMCFPLTEQSHLLSMWKWDGTIRQKSRPLTILFPQWIQISAQSCSEYNNKVFILYTVLDNIVMCILYT